VAETLLAVIHDYELNRCQRFLKNRRQFFFSRSAETSGDNEFGQVYVWNALNALNDLNGLNCPRL